MTTVRESPPGPDIDDVSHACAMRTLVFAHDWNTTLGPVPSWPQSLRAAVELILPNGFPQIILWGRELIQIYNDGYRLIMADKHPAGLGQPTRECWPEVWHINRPIYERVFRGETVMFEDALYPLVRRGRLADAWFDLCYSPMRDDAGAITGVLVTLMERTDRHLARIERARAAAVLQQSDERQSALLELGDALRSLSDARAVCGQACRIVGRRLKVDRAYFADVDAAGNATFGCDYRSDGTRSMPGCYRMDAFGVAAADALRAGDTLAVDDLEAWEPLGDEEGQRCRACNMRAVLTVPLVKGGRLCAFLALHQAEPRHWTAAEIALVEEIAQRTWSAIERARAETALRIGEEKYRSLFESIDQGFCVIETERDEQGKIIDLWFREANPAFEWESGMPGALDRPISKVMPEYERQWLDAIARVLQSGEAAGMEDFKAATGRWYSVQFSRIGGEDSNLVAAVFNDITEHKRTERTQGRLAAIVESSDDAIISKDLDGIIQTWNLGAERLFGYTASEVLGQPVTILMPSDRVDEEPAILASIRAGKRIDHYETVRRRKDGTLLDVSLTISPVLDAAGNVVAASKIARDITDRKRAEAKLQESEQRYRTLFDSVDEGFCVVELQFDAAGKAVDYIFIEANPVVESQTGQGTLIGRRISEVAPGMEHSWLETFGQVARSGNAERFERRSVNVNRWYSVYAFRVGDPALCRVAILSQEVTQRKALEESLRIRQEQQGFLLRLSDALRVELDERAIGATCVQMVAEHLGIDRCYITNLSRDEDRARMGPEYRRGDLPSAYGESGEVALSAFPACQQRMETQSLVINDVTVEPGFSDAEKTAIVALHGLKAIVAVPLRAGERNAIWALVAGSDVSRQWLPHEVRLLEHVAERTWAAIQRAIVEEALRENQVRLQNANRVKDEFLAMLGHELRNPLAPISTTLQLMKLRAPDTFVRERDIIEAQVRYLTSLVDDLLDVSRIASGKIELKMTQLDVAGIVAAAVETTQTMLEERQHSLHLQVAERLVVSGDRRRLVQVVVNLLGNAAKYSPPGRNIWLTASAEQGQAVLRVRDEGQGIDAELLPRVFGIFSQGRQAIDRSHGGLGLGLAIVRNMVTLHGGSVEAASEGPYKGSEFTVRLPLVEQPPTRGAGSVQAESAKPAIAERAARTRVLIVDDYVLAAESMALLLQEMGYHTHVVHDGAAALQAFKTFDPQVALVDIGLPVIDGYEVAQTVRRMPGRAQVPLIAVTGYGQPGDRVRVLAAGFDDHLVKPLDASRISELIEQMVDAG